jgi:acyl-CoA thioester hydrolase
VSAASPSLPGSPSPRTAPPAGALRHFALEARVYYEDTDAGGIVYHANYLRWMERVRTEWLRALGAHHSELAGREGLQFVVSELSIRYLRPARLDDLIRVDLQVTELKRASLRLSQSVWPVTDSEDVGERRRPLVEAVVRVAVMNRNTARPAALPAWLLRTLGSE